LRAHPAVIEAYLGAEAQP